MPEDRRARQTGGTYFSTVNLLQRRGNDLLICEIELLRSVVASVSARNAITIHAGAVLPEHLNYLLGFPQRDSDFALRWRLIRTEFSKALPKTERISSVRAKRGERGVLQRRYWEHLIRAERDFAARMDYVHFNPVKHGHVKHVGDGPHQHFNVLLRAVCMKQIGEVAIPARLDMTIDPRTGMRRAFRRHALRSLPLYAFFVLRLFARPQRLTLGGRKRRSLLRPPRRKG